MWLECNRKEKYRAYDYWNPVLMSCELCYINCINYLKITYKKDDVLCSYVQNITCNLKIHSGSCKYFSSVFSSTLRIERFKRRIWDKNVGRKMSQLREK